MKAKSDNLRKAKAAKNDEFYTRLEDIEAEISSHPDYVRQFQDKTVLCPCDDPEWSNFFVFFKNHFKQLGINKLITTHYNADGSPSYKIEWDGEMLNDDMVNLIKTPLKENGDFRSDEVKEIMEMYGEELIVVTNPMFSLFREFIAQLEEYKCKYVLLGNMNAITYKEFFPLLKNNKVFIGYDTGAKTFRVPDSFENSSTFVQDGIKYAKFGNICWFTNLDLDKTHDFLPLTKNYRGNEKKYPYYDNYNAINCDKVTDIPKDFSGAVGVPITYMTQHCMDQFNILGMSTVAETMDTPVQFGTEFINKYREQGGTGHFSPNMYGVCYFDKNGKAKVPYGRIIIQRIKTKESEDK